MNAVLTPSLCKPSSPVSPAKTLPAEVEFYRGGARVSGYVLLTRFVLPCGWDRFEASQISEDDWMHLLAIALNKSEPEHIIQGLLNGLFPGFVGGLYEHCGPNNVNNAWSYQNVLEYLLKHKGHADECAARCYTIRGIAAPQMSPITGDLREVFWADREEHRSLINLYQIDPEIGSIVLAHKSVIVTKVMTA